jgi:hypothetical protein
VHAKVTPDRKPPEKRREHIEFCRNRFETTPNHWNLRELVAGLIGEANIQLSEGKDPQRSLSMAAEAVDMLPRYASLSDAVNPEPFTKSEMAVWAGRVLDVCERVGNAAAYQLAKKVVAMAHDMADDVGAAGRLSTLEQRLYKLQLRATGSFQAARPHFERYLSLHPRVRDEASRKSYRERSLPVGTFHK